MNTDYMVQDIGLREKQYRRNVNSRGDTRHYDDSCKTIKQYAKEQNTVYDPMTNQILYGINSNMHVSGVSDGTCNQINPLIFTPRYICGAGTAGGNRCVKDVLAQDPYSAHQITQLKNAINKQRENFERENFESGTNSNCNGCKTTEVVIFLLALFILIGLIYWRRTNKN